MDKGQKRQAFIFLPHFRIILVEEEEKKGLFQFNLIFADLASNFDGILQRKKNTILPNSNKLMLLYLFKSVDPRNAKEAKKSHNFCLP